MWLAGSRGAMPAASAETSPRPVDVALCRQRAHGKPDLAADMLQGLLASLPATRDELATSDADHLATLLATTHKLHGACCYSGTPRLQQASRALEELLKQNDAPAAQATAARDELIAAIDELMEWSEHHDVAALFDGESAAAL